MTARVSENALTLLKERYFIDGEKTPEDLFRRVAHGAAQAEKEKERQYWEDKFFYGMDNLDFMPNSPALMNVGTEIKNYSACFVIPVPDSMEGIFEAVKQAALISKSGGGVGLSFSRLRPKNAKVGSTGGVASGPVSFTYPFNAMVECVRQGLKRRGALMGLLRVDHPDIEEFIRVKDDLTQLTNFNLSVGITDEFMEAVINDKDFDLRFEGKVYKTVRAKDLWNQIIQHAWLTGDPGLLFLDEANRHNTLKHVGDIETSNPCLHKDTYLVTENGLEKISKLKSNIWNGDKFTTASSWKTGVKKIYRIMTASGFEYSTTANHKFLLADGTWCNAIDLIGKEIKFDYSEKQWEGHNPYPEVNYNILGFELGDGGYHKSSNRMTTIFATKDKDQQVIDLIEKEFNDSFRERNGKFSIDIKYGSIYANAFDGRIETRLIPDWILKLPKKEMKDFLRGLLSANGCNMKKYRKIQLVSINKPMLQQVQQMLLLFGIKAKLWYHNKEKTIKFSNGTYTCKTSYHLVISRDSYIKYLDTIGFIQDYKNGYNECKQPKTEDNYETVILISELDDEEVWDFSESENHQGITNGAYVHNCGEQPLLPFEACNLLSINLLNMVDDGEINWDKLKETINVAVRFLDNIIEISEFPLPEIDDFVRQNRKIGLGLMGFADLLYKMKIPYNSKDGLFVAEVVQQFIYDEALKVSVDLAKERGIYPNAKNDNKRNAALTTIAPTGSISMICNVSGGCEPNFGLLYKRFATSMNKEFYFINQVLEEELKNRGLYSEELLEKINKNGGSVKGIEEIPEDMQKVFVTASEISPEWHIKMQATFQNNGVDSAVSKTINLPNSATVKDVEDAYMLAYRLKCKGTTVYRDGCRNNQVLTTGSSMSENNLTKDKHDDNVKQELHFPPALTEAYGKHKKYQTGCGSLWIDFYVDQDGNLVEIRTKAKDGGCQANIESLSRMISKCLGLKVKHEDICDQLRSAYCKNSFDKTGCRSCGHVIAKAIEEFDKQNINIVPIPKDIKPEIEIKTQENINKENKECTHPRMIRQEGCEICPDCNYSKCS